MKRPIFKAVGKEEGKMNRKPEYIIADPSGNITAFVLTPTERQQYSSVAGQILSETDAEQVAFVKSVEIGNGSPLRGRIEMSGMEFCGNAARSFALLLARMAGKTGKCDALVEVSGWDKPLEAEADIESGYTKIEMPPVLSVQKRKEDVFYVELPGISHVILRNAPPDESVFLSIRDAVMNRYDPPAVGVLFYEEKESRMTPVVYVKDTDFFCWEGSCGSGTVALVSALSSEKEDGLYRYEIRQPAGKIGAVVLKENGAVKKVSIEGAVTFREDQK